MWRQRVAVAAPLHMEKEHTSITFAFPTPPEIKPCALARSTSFAAEAISCVSPHFVGGVHRGLVPRLLSGLVAPPVPSGFDVTIQVPGVVSKPIALRCASPPFWMALPAATRKLSTNCRHIVSAVGSGVFWGQTLSQVSSAKLIVVGQTLSHTDEVCPFLRNVVNYCSAPCLSLVQQLTNFVQHAFLLVVMLAVEWCTDEPPGLC